MIYGVTGTRGLTTHGRRNIMVALAKLLDHRGDYLVVGGCVGVDAFAGQMGKLMRLPVHVVLPSAEDGKWLDHGWREYASTWENGGTYRQRNERIVQMCEHLLGFPAWPEKLDNPRSGTWMTIRIARRAGKPTTVTPQGRAARS